MKQAKGDMWTFAPADARVITTNGDVKRTRDGAVIGCVMGRGVAQQARDRFPFLDYSLGCYIMQYGNRVFDLGMITEPPGDGARIVSFPVKHHWWAHADPALIAASAAQLAALANKRLWRAIVLPRPGCGNGGLSWEQVGPLLVDALDDRFTVLEFDA